MPIITLRGAIVAGVLSRQVAGKDILFFPSNSVRLLMGSSNEDEKISADDIVGLLTHFSVSRAIKDYVAEGMLYHYPQLVIKKGKVNQIIIHMFKSSIVAPLGSHSIMVHLAPFECTPYFEMLLEQPHGPILLGVVVSPG